MISRKKTVSSIIAPMKKIIDDLTNLSTENKDVAASIRERASELETEAKQADELIKKYSAFVS